LSHFDTWHNSEVTRVKSLKNRGTKSSKIQKKSKKFKNLKIQKNPEIDTWRWL